MSKQKTIPKINVGRYAGTPIDQLPNSYLRWILTQNFPKEWADIAREKLDKSTYSSDYITISRHTYDQYSLRFIDRWHERADKSMGIGTFVAKEADRAWEKGKNISKNRYKDDGILKELEGIVWAFDVSPHFPDCRDIITCYPLDNKMK